jgi:hypothetical protein
MKANARLYNCAHPVAVSRPDTPIERSLNDDMNKAIKVVERLRYGRLDFAKINV